MASRRPPIEVSELSQGLRESTGRGLNAFFTAQPPAPPIQTVTPPPTPKNQPAPRYSGTPVPGDRDTTVPRREIKRRHPFDVYRDQLRVLKDFSIEEKRAGGIGSESAMVREALDAFIDKRRKK
jgi:hypothetical protein